jgi:ATP-dependent Clp endopeptidase proteolytic subunit ClpP
MQTVYKTNKKIKEDVFNKDVQPILVNVVNEQAVEKFYKKFNECISAELPFIPIYIDSYGGNIHSLFAMLDIIDSSPVPVATICVGKAMSCGAILLASGAKGYRYAGAQSRILLHEASAGSVGKVSDMEQDIKHAQDLNRSIYDLLDKRTANKKGFFQDKLKANKNSDLHVTPIQAKSWGIIDKIGVPRLVAEADITYSLQ